MFIPASPTAHDVGPHTAGHRTKRSSSKIVAGILAFLICAAVGVGTTSMTPAGATSFTHGDFSPYVPPQTRYVDDCTVEIGPVYDSSASDWRKIGGVRVNCATVHYWVDATVALYYYNFTLQRWVQVGSSGYGIRYYSKGSGTGIGGILESGPACGKGYYWATAATVRTDRGVTKTVWSDSSPSAVWNGC